MGFGPVSARRTNSGQRHSAGGRRARRRKRRVAVVTGTRAEYGLLKSTMQAVDAHPRLTLQTVVTGMHLLKEFGYTVQDIVRDGWTVAARVRMQQGTDDARDQAAGLARGVSGIARFLESAGTDLVVVLGDRIEAMAGALATVTTGRVLAHVHGGDVAPGDFDDSLRHAITKLAHVHLPATRDAARRIARLGEDPGRIHVVGAPGLDRLRELLGEVECHRVAHRFSGGGHESPTKPSDANHPYTLIIYHAWGRPAATEARTMTTILRSARAAGLRRLIIYPNTDRGHRGVLRAIEQHARQSPPDDVQVRQSLPRDDYLRALINAAVLIGNSSSGIIEAPLAGTPSVNVGQRQAGRQPGGRAVIQVDETPTAIRAGLQAALRKRPTPGGRSVYGNGHAGECIASILADEPLTESFSRKVVTY